MSKTLDSIRRLSPKENLLDDHIANTYFYQKRHKRKAKPYLKNIKINYVAASSFLLAFCLIALAPHLHRQYINTLREKISGAGVIKIIDEGRLNSLPVQRFAFRGCAKAKSRFSDKYIILNSPKKYNWADASVDFKFPIDFSKRFISLSLKGSIGGERVSLVLRDSNNKSSRLGDIYLTSDWKTDRLSLDGIRKDIDLSSITHMRMEYDYIGESAKDVDSPIDVTIYLKDFHILKER